MLSIIDRGELGGLDGRNWTQRARRSLDISATVGSVFSRTRKDDFRTRKYGRPEWDTWTDARWQEEPNEDFYYPYALRDPDGEWWEDHP